MKFFRSTSGERSAELAELARALELSPVRWSGGRLSGKRGNVFVELEARGEEIVISAGPIHPLPPGLRVIKGSGEGITLEDGELQAAVHVQCANPAAAIRLLRTAAVRVALLRAALSSEDLALSGEWLSARVAASSDVARAGCTAVLKLLAALGDAAVELSLRAAEEREAAKELPVPEGGKRFVALEPTDAFAADWVNELRREARARVVWGSPRAEVLTRLRELGASETLALKLYSEARLEHDAGRKAALLGRSALAAGALVVGFLLSRIPLPGVHLRGHLPPFAVAAGIVIGWGIWQLALGVGRYLLDRAD